MGRPVAVHLGYHKTATTWLQDEIFPSNPHLGLVGGPIPPANDFLRSIIMEPDRSFDAASARRTFDRMTDGVSYEDPGRLLVSSEHLSGHAGTGGYDAFRIADRLARTLPGAKVFFMVREQVSMIESEYRQLVFEGSPAKLEQLLARPSETMRPGFDLGHYEYDRLADRYAELFGADNVRLFEFGAMLGRPLPFLEELATFLEIGPWPELPTEVLERRVNATLPRRFLGARRRLNHLQKSGLNPHPMISMRPVWRTPLWALANRLPPPRQPLLDDATSARLRERFRASNDRLAERYGVVFAGDRG